MLWMAWTHSLLRPSLARAMGCFITEELRTCGADARDGRNMIRTWRAGSGVDGNTPCVKYLELEGWSCLGILLMNDCSCSFKWRYKS